PWRLRESKEDLQAGDRDRKAESNVSSSDLSDERACKPVLGAWRGRGGDQIFKRGRGDDPRPRDAKRACKGAWMAESAASGVEPKRRGTALFERGSRALRADWRPRRRGSSVDRARLRPREQQDRRCRKTGDLGASQGSSSRRG